MLGLRLLIQWLSGFPGSASGKEPAWQCRRCKRRGFDPWVGKIPLDEGVTTPSSIVAGTHIRGFTENAFAWESASQCRGHGFPDPWSRKIPYTAEQLSPSITTAEPVLYSLWAPTAEPACTKSWSPCTTLLSPQAWSWSSDMRETPEMRSLPTATKGSPRSWQLEEACVATNIQRSQNTVFTKKISREWGHRRNIP